MYYTVQFTTSFKRENCSIGNFIQNSRNPLSLHILIYISLKKKKHKEKKKNGTGSTWFLPHVAATEANFLLYRSFFIAIQLYLWSLTNSASTVIFLYCRTSLICNNRFSFTLWKGVVSVVLAYVASGYVLLC